MDDFKEAPLGYTIFNSEKAVLAELEQVASTIEKLKIFLKSEMISNLSSTNQELLGLQLDNLKSQAGILALRLKNW